MPCQQPHWYWLLALPPIVTCTVIHGGDAVLQLDRAISSRVIHDVLLDRGYVDIHHFKSLR